MAEYLERDAAVAIIEEKQKELCPAGRFGRRYVDGSDRDAYDAWQEMIDQIEALPPTDVAPVVHGRWKPNTDDFTPALRCSICGYNAPIIAGEGVYQPPNNYCSNCGAKMDGERSDSDDL